MMLALLVLACVAAAWGLARLARGAGVGWGAAAVLGACTVPLLAFLALQLQAPAARTGHAFEVRGQFHQFGQSVTIGTDPASDFVLEGDEPVTLTAAYDPQADGIAIAVRNTLIPVMVGARPINAARLRRTSTVRDAAAGLAQIARPWWCWYRCTTRHVRTGDGGEVELSTDSAALLRVGADTIVLFRYRGADYVSARGQAGVSVDGVPVPERATVEPGTLQVGAAARTVAELALDVSQQRLEIRFPEGSRRRRAPLEPDGERFRFAVSTNPELQGWGTLPLIDPVALAPAVVRSGYGGVLELVDGNWLWSSHGGTRVLTRGEEELLPSPAAPAGHLVAIVQHDTDPARARLALVGAWLLGALLLAAVWWALHPIALGWRVGTVGLLYTLVFLRATLGFRAWLAPPEKAATVITVLGLAIALPAMIALLHCWERYAVPGREWRRALPWAGAIALQLAASLALVLLLVTPSWRFPIAVAALAPLVVGAPALALLARALTAPAGAALPGPLAMLGPAAGSSTLRQFARAVAVLFLLGLLIPLVTRLLGAGKLMAVMGVFAVLAAAILLGSRRRQRVRRRGPARRILYVAVLAGLAAVTGLALRQPLAAVAGAGLAGLAGWWWFGRGGPRRVRPVHAEDLLQPSLLVATLLGTLVVITLGAVRALAVIGEYALALGGLLVFVRIFAVLWYRVLDGVAPHRQVALGALPGIGAVLGALAVGTLIFLPLGLADPGLLMLFLGASVIAAVVGLSILGPRGILAGTATALALAASIFVGMYVGPNALRAGGAQLSTPEVRYAAVSDPDGLQDHLLGARENAPFRIINTLQQSWAMRSYAALGKSAGKGYFEVDFTNRGSTWPVALTDNAFSVFVLSEHGWLGGSAVVLVYLLLGFVLLNGAMHCRELRPRVPRAFLLVGLAAFWVLPTLYLAAANGLRVPLTGQNIPMLGLLSAADVALAVWLAALALVALPTATASGEEHLPARVTDGVRWTVRAIAAAFGVAGIAVIALLWGPTHATAGDFVLERVVARGEELVSLGALRPAVVADGPDTIAVAESAQRIPELQRGAFLERAIRRSNSMAGGGAAGAQCHQADALFRVTTTGDIAVFSSLCRVQAVTTTTAAWRGRLLGRGGGARYVVSSGTSVVVLDAAATEPLAALGAGCGAAGMVFARAARIGCGEDGAILTGGTDAVLLQPRGDTILVNGAPAAGPLLLGAGDHLRVSGMDLLSDSVPRSALGYARRVNGRWRRFVERGSSPLLAQIDSQFARGLSLPAESTEDVHLTLDLPLHRALQRRVADACAGIPGVARCSVLLAEPTGGAIRAFAQWPVPTTYPRDLPADANLRNHPAASAVKPLMAAGALAAYPALADLEIDHAQGSYDVIANVPLRDTVRAARLYPRPRVPFAAFLPASDNLFAATLGFLATAPEGAGGLPARSGNADRSELRVAGRSLPGAPAWRRDGNGLALEASPLAKSLESLFEIAASRTGAPVIDRRFWEGAVAAGALPGGAELQRITPEPVGLALEDVGTPRELATFMIGGGGNRWSNVAMVEAASRIVTANRVHLHLLDSLAAEPAWPKPDSLHAMRRVRPAVVAGMRGVITEPWGTAAALRSEFPPRVHWIAKTGTLREREWTGSIFLFVGLPASPDAPVCATAGIVTIELEAGGNPDGVATRFFQGGIAGLLRERAGWGARGCVL